MKIYRFNQTVRIYKKTYEVFSHSVLMAKEGSHISHADEDSLIHRTGTCSKQRKITEMFSEVLRFNAASAATSTKGVLLD